LEGLGGFGGSGGLYMLVGLGGHSQRRRFCFPEENKKPLILDSNYLEVTGHLADQGAEGREGRLSTE